MPHYRRLQNTLEWRDIPGCPGRCVLYQADAELDRFVRDCATRFECASARDPVLLTKLPDMGGLLSYERADGTLVHTLNTESGLQRKCAQLGIDLIAWRAERLQDCSGEDTCDLLIGHFGRDRVWAIRLIRTYTLQTVQEAAKTIESTPYTLVLGWRGHEVLRLLEELEAHGGEGTVGLF